MTSMVGTCVGARKGRKDDFFCSCFAFTVRRLRGEFLATFLHVFGVKLVSPSQRRQRRYVLPRCGDAAPSATATATTCLPVSSLSLLAEKRRTTKAGALFLYGGWNWKASSPSATSRFFLSPPFISNRRQRRKEVRGERHSSPPQSVSPLALFMPVRNPFSPFSLHLFPLNRRVR